MEYALSRLARALETIDDSGGFRFYCEETLQKLHVQAAQRLDLSGEKLATHLYEIAFGESHDFYPKFPDAYSEALGSAPRRAAIWRPSWRCIRRAPPRCRTT